VKKPVKTDLWKELFAFGEPDTPGRRTVRLAFEIFIVYATIRLAWTWGLYTLRISEVVLPLGVARWVDISFMFGNDLPIVNAALITILAAAGLFRYGRWSYAAAFLLLVVQYAARFSLGEIPHSANMAGMGLLGFALGVVLYPRREDASKFALGFAYFYLGLGYSLAAVSKYVARGLTWPDGHHLWMWLNEKSVDHLSKTGALQLNWLQEWALADHTVATLFLAFGLLTETFAFLLWWRRFRIPVCMAILGLHMGIYLTMNIMFILSVYELLIIGLPWALLLDRTLFRGSDDVLRAHRANA
jgi:hypothetical protein